MFIDNNELNNRPSGSRAGPSPTSRSSTRAWTQLLDSLGPTGRPSYQQHSSPGAGIDHSSGEGSYLGEGVAHISSQITHRLAFVSGITY